MLVVGCWLLVIGYCRPYILRKQKHPTNTPTLEHARSLPRCKQVVHELHRRIHTTSAQCARNHPPSVAHTPPDTYCTTLTPHTPQSTYVSADSAATVTGIAPINRLLDKSASLSTENVQVQCEHRDACGCRLCTVCECAAAAAVAL